MNIPAAEDIPAAAAAVDLATAVVAAAVDPAIDVAAAVDPAIDVAPAVDPAIAVAAVAAVPATVAAAGEEQSLPGFQGLRTDASRYSSTADHRKSRIRLLLNSPEKRGFHKKIILKLPELLNRCPAPRV